MTRCFDGSSLLAWEERIYIIEILPPVLVVFFPPLLVMCAFGQTPDWPSFMISIGGLVTRTSVSFQPNLQPKLSI